MRRRHGEAEYRREHDDARRAEFGGEPARGVDLGDPLTDRRHDPTSDVPESGQQGDAERDEDRQRNGRRFADPARAEHVEHRGEGSDGVGDVVGAVTEREHARGEDLHPGEEDEGGLLEFLLLERLREDVHGRPDGDADHRDEERDDDGINGDFEVRQSLHQEHAGEDDRRDGGDDGHERLQRVVPLLTVVLRGAQNEPLDQPEDPERDDAPEQRRENPGERDLTDRLPLHHLEAAEPRLEPHRHRGADNAADDRVSGRDGPAHARGEEEPQRRAEERRHHNVDEIVRALIDDLDVDDAAAHRVGDGTAREHGAGDLEHGGDEKCLLHRQGAGSDARAERVRDVVATDVERHEDAEHDGGDQQDTVGAVRDPPERPQRERHQADRQQPAEAEMPPLILRVRCFEVSGALVGVGFRLRGGVGRHRCCLPGVRGGTPGGRPATRSHREVNE